MQPVEQGQPDADGGQDRCRDRTAAFPVGPGVCGRDFCGVYSVWLIGAKGRPDLLNWPLVSWWPFLVATVCLVIVIWLVVQLIARVNKDTDPAAADHEMLLALSELHREGDLTVEEFRSIKSQLVHRLSSNDGRFSVNKKTADSAAAGTAQIHSERDKAETEAAESTGLES